MLSIRLVWNFVVLTLVLLSFSSSTSAQNLSVPYSECASNTLFKISNVLANEWPPKKGTDLTVLFDGVVLENVTDGHYEISVTWETLPVYDEKGDIKELLLNQTLPISNGTFCYLDKNVELKSEIPDGSYVVKVEAWDVNNKIFTCFEVKFKLNEQQPQLPPVPPSPIGQPVLPQHPNSNIKIIGDHPHGKLKLRRERRG